LDTFPPENTDFAASNFEEGWGDFVNVRLKEFLEK
jgi:hypothetical protein